MALFSQVIISLSEKPDPLKMKTVGSSEILVTTHKTSKQWQPRDPTLKYMNSKYVMEDITAQLLMRTSKNIYSSPEMCLFSLLKSQYNRLLITQMWTICFVD
jgi:hypothetical protein